MFAFVISPAPAAPVADPVSAPPLTAHDWPAASIRTHNGLRLALGATLASRLLVWTATLVTIAIFGENMLARRMLDPDGTTTFAHPKLLKVLLTPAGRWDSVWYLEIAAHGYFKPATANFYPLYPALVGLAAPVFGNALLAGVAISAGSLLLGLMLLYRLTRLELGEPAARTTVMLVALFPTSLFLSAVYPTSIFLLLTVAAAYAARCERWAVAGTCGGLAAASRSNGILVAVLLTLMYLYGPRSRGPQRSAGPWWRPRFRLERDMAWLALVPAGLAAYLGYLLVAHGAPLAPVRAAHLYWAHSFGPPLAAIVDAVGKVPADLGSLITGTTTPIGPGDPLSWQSRNLIDVLFLAVAAAGVALAWSRVPRAYVIYAVLLLVQVTSFPTATEPMIGLPRYMLSMFPLFMGVGAYLVERRGAARVTIATSTVLLVLFSGLWGYWALVP